MEPIAFVRFGGITESNPYTLSLNDSKNRKRNSRQPNLSDRANSGMVRAIIDHVRNQCKPYRRLVESRHTLYRKIEPSPPSLSLVLPLNQT